MTTILLLPYRRLKKTHKWHKMKIGLKDPLFPLKQKQRAAVALQPLIYTNSEDSWLAIHMRMFLSPVVLAPSHVINHGGVILHKHTLIKEKQRMKQKKLGKFSAHLHLNLTIKEPNVNICL